MDSIPHLDSFLTFLEWSRVRERIASRTSSSPGRNWARGLQPSFDREVVEARLARSAEALVVLRADTAPDLDRIPDLPETFERLHAQNRGLSSRELRGVAATILAGVEAREAFEAHPLLLEQVTIDPEREAEDVELAEEIQARIGAYGFVLDDATERLEVIRQRMRSTRERLRARLQQLTLDPSIMLALEEHRAVEYQERLCLKVKADEIRRVPGPIIGEEPGFLFVEADGAHELYNEARHLELDERAEVQRIVDELSSRVRENQEAHDQLSRGLIQADIHLAMARYAEDADLHPPTLSNDLRLGAERARHPLLIEDGCVPIDVEMGPSCRLLVISGPNGGGKTVAMKTVGLIAALAQSGCFVPAAPGCRLPVFNAFLSVAEAHSSVQEGLSTFQAHARDLAALAEASESGSLVLLDEVGVGTDPGEAAALAQAFLEFELDKEVLTLATTHLSPLKAFAEKNPDSANAAVSLNDDGKPTFVLTLGAAGRSYALEVARQAGLPASICDRARRLHSGSEEQE